MSTSSSSSSRHSSGLYGRVLVVGFLLVVVSGLWQATPRSFWFIGWFIGASILTLLVYKSGTKRTEGPQVRMSNSSGASTKAVSLGTLGDVLLCLSVALGLCVLAPVAFSSFYLGGDYQSQLSRLTSIYNSSQWLSAHLKPLLYCGLGFFALFVFALNRFLYSNDEPGASSSNFRQALIARRVLLTLVCISCAGLLFPSAYPLLVDRWIRETKGEIKNSPKKPEQNGVTGVPSQSSRTIPPLSDPEPRSRANDRGHQAPPKVLGMYRGTWYSTPVISSERYYQFREGHSSPIEYCTFYFSSGLDLVLTQADKNLVSTVKYRIVVSSKICLPENPLHSEYIEAPKWIEERKSDYETVFPSSIESASENAIIINFADCTSCKAQRMLLTKNGIKLNWENFSKSSFYYDYNVSRINSLAFEKGE
jgi:hypothetical protein